MHILEFTFKNVRDAAKIDWTRLGVVTGVNETGTKIAVEIDLAQWYSNQIAREIEEYELVAVVTATMAACGFWPKIAVQSS